LLLNELVDRLHIWLTEHFNLGKIHSKLYLIVTFALFYIKRDVSLVMLPFLGKIK
jgi:hypothetical protein